MIEKLTIKNLLSDYTLIVPEIQREYVWGDPSNSKNVLVPFLEGLNYNLTKCNDYNIGFLYSYTFTGSEKYIIDGQQRITTIILLLYVLSCKENELIRDKFLEIISINKPTMSFTYNVRPQTETFMRKLFISGKTNKEDIFNQKWFLKSYEQDMTIKSIVNAIDTMGKILDDLPNISYETILANISFWYFNVDETSQGEELYITMNSRGQKLTASEQLKPNLFDQWRSTPALQSDKIDYGKEWDLWEEMFYHMEDNVDIQSVNNAMDRFLQIVIEIEGENGIATLPHKTNIVTLPIIRKYMIAMKQYAYNHINELLSTKEDEFKVLKALIAEGLKNVHDSRDKIRIEKIFHNITTRRGYNCDHGLFLKFIHQYSLSDMNFYDFILTHKQLCEGVFDDHELNKILIYIRFNNAKIEEAFWNTESSKIWKGNIAPIINWACTSEDIKTFDFEKFLEYKSVSEMYFSDEKLQKPEMDLIRRALLTQKLTNYPKIFKGNRVYSFGYSSEEWKSLIKENSEEFKDFFDKLLSGQTLQEMIDAYPIEADFSEFVKDERLLDFCEEKKLQYWWGTWFLMKKERWSGAHANIKAYKYYLNENKNNYKGWAIGFWPYELSCVCYDKNVQGNSVAMDLLWNSGSNNNELEINIFVRVKRDENDKTKKFLFDVAEKSGLAWIDGRYRKYIKMPKDEIDSYIIMNKYRNDIIDSLNAMDQ